MTEIINGLHQIGAHEFSEIENAALVIDMAGHIPDFNTPILRYKIPDGPIKNIDTDCLETIARIGYWTLVSGNRNVFVACLAGQNRSGLIVGLILKHVGRTGMGAVNLIQSKRENALNNESFVEHLINERN